MALMMARIVKPTVRPTMSPTGLNCLEEDEEDEEELGNDEGGKEKMVEMVAVVVVGEGKGVVGMTTVTVREVDRFEKIATFVEYGRGVGSGVTTGLLDDVESTGLLPKGQAFDNPQGSIEQQPTNLFAAQA
ncbi:hypothetical protein J7T55_008601 [Diaporthe amygdali]|uniref:uncharacterized protein n=1 Tax=Phomopsis amygdali TaxID=1214568 RepID=UPI0022FE5947|nr:uncharacterized protein J7T55_008601 [Diaporthe amygdali]KAJ0121437.1 hypothetical protein J7T55_008601 [Diaporthe amygdali]